MTHEPFSRRPVVERSDLLAHPLWPIGAVRNTTFGMKIR
jgi:hypothetical protein